MINVDKLHEVMTSKSLPEDWVGKGWTTAILYLLLGEAELGDPDNAYLIITYNHAWALHVVREFKKLLQKENLSHLIISEYPFPEDPCKVQLADGKQFIFIEVGGISHLHGLCIADVYFDMGVLSWHDLSLDDKSLISTLLINGRTLNDNSNFTKR